MKTPTFKDDHGDYDTPAILRFCAKGCGYFVVGCVALWLLIGLIGPQLKLYSARTAKQAIVAEAQAQSEAELARAERRKLTAAADGEARRTEADAIRDAQATIDSSLTPEYIQWFFIDRLDDVQGQILYVPTEGGMPITEAGRAVAEPQP